MTFSNHVTDYRLIIYLRVPIQCILIPIFFIGCVEHNADTY